MLYREIGMALPSTRAACIKAEPASETSVAGL